MFLNDVSTYASVLVLLIEIGVASICKLFGMLIETKNRYHKITWGITLFTVYAYVIGFVALMLSSAYYEVGPTQAAAAIGTLALLAAMIDMARLAITSFCNAPPGNAQPRTAAGNRMD